jgi:hypothetical protein
MKTITFLVLFAIPIFSFGQSVQTTVDKLKAEVHGDTVILRDDSAYRNCGASYEMQLTIVNDTTFRWIQKDKGSIAYCDCNFNLSCTVDSLKPGDYTVNTYYTYPGSSSLKYVGKINFTISAPNNYVLPSIINQAQSPCFIVGIAPENEPSDCKIKVYPNPASRYIKIATDMPETKTIMITDITNHCVLQFNTDQKETLVDLINLPSQMYFITVKSKGQVVHSKVYKTN